LLDVLHERCFAQRNLLSCNQFHQSRRGSARRGQTPRSGSLGKPSLVRRPQGGNTSVASCRWGGVKCGYLPAKRDEARVSPFRLRNGPGRPRARRPCHVVGASRPYQRRFAPKQKAGQRHQLPIANDLSLLSGNAPTQQTACMQPEEEDRSMGMKCQ